MLTRRASALMMLAANFARPARERASGLAEHLPAEPPPAERLPALSCHLLRLRFLAGARV